MGRLETTTNPEGTPASAPNARRARLPGRPRREDLDESILKVTLDVLKELGYSRFTVNEVIARAGVSSATVYRRWPTTQDLVVAALRTVTPEPLAIDTGTLEGDVSEFLAYLGRAITRREWLAGGGGVGLSDAVFADLIKKTFLKPRQEALRKILERANRRGELGRMPPLDDCWSYVVGPFNHLLFTRRERVTSAFVASTATFVVAGLRALCRERKS
jgi:AcrR family transcriptional regulator